MVRLNGHGKDISLVFVCDCKRCEKAKARYLKQDHTDTVCGYAVGAAILIIGGLVLWAGYQYIAWRLGWPL